MAACSPSMRRLPASSVTPQGEVLQGLPFQSYQQGYRYSRGASYLRCQRVLRTGNRRSSRSGHRPYQPRARFVPQATKTQLSAPSKSKAASKIRKLSCIHVAEKYALALYSAEPIEIAGIEYLLVSCRDITERKVAEKTFAFLKRDSRKPFVPVRR